MFHEGCATDSSRLENILKSDVANSIEQDLREFWESRGEEGESVQRELQQLRMLLFRKRKLPVARDLWIPGAAQPGEQQYVETIVSETFVLQQIKDVIQKREEWLVQQRLPLDTQMRDNIERKDFLQWAKDEYHSDPFQLDLQRRDAEEFAGMQHKLRYTKLQGRKNSRWNRELQRRLGSAPLWYVVSFTGRFDVDLLRQVS